MYRIGTSHSRFELCRRAICMSRSSPLCVNSEKAINNDTLCAEKSGPNLESYISSSPKSYLNVVSFSTKSDPHSSPNINPYLESSYKGPPDSSTLQEEDKRICAVERLPKGKLNPGQERKKGRITGYVYDKGTPDQRHVLFVMEKYQIQSLWSRLGEARFLLTVFTLEVFDGFGSPNILYKLPVLPRRVNYDERGHICNIGFAKALPGVRVQLDTRIHIYGQEDCIGLKKGGYLKVHLEYVSLVCSPEELPPYVMIDVTMMDIGDKVCLGDLKFEVPLHSRNESSSVVCELV